MTKRTEDLRVTKTKQKLFYTFMSLLEIMDFDSITVGDLCSFSGIRRATFYKHFTDKTNFCKYAFEELHRRFDEKSRNVAKGWVSLDYFSEYAKKIIDFIDDNEKIVNQIFSSTTLASILHTAVEQSCEKLLTLLSQSDIQGVRLPASPEITSVMLLGSTSAAIVSWLKSKKAMPKEILCEEISSVIRKALEP